MSEPLLYPFTAPPAAGEAIEVAPGIRWIRMPLPFALDHINLWQARAPGDRDHSAGGPDPDPPGEEEV